MGVGDEIMAAGQARRLQALDPRKVRIVYRGMVPRWNEVWLHNPRIAQPSDLGDFQILENGPGCRPYIKEKTAQQWVWRDWDCPKGEIYLTLQEVAFGEHYQDRVIIEPHLKRKASPNKDWGILNWVRVAELMRRAGIRYAQLGPRGTRILEGAEHIVTDTFRQAAAVLANSVACVVPEGGLHHAAAALGIPAVVIYGGFISPKQTGYEDQVSIFTGGSPCGMRIPCSHCAKAMSQIKPDRVFHELERLLGSKNQAMGRLASAGV